MLFTTSYCCALLLFLAPHNAIAEDNDAAKDAPLLWLFSPLTRLGRSSPAGTAVQFDGPLRISDSIPQNRSVAVSVSEPFFLRNHFRVEARQNSSGGGGPLGPGQPLQLVLREPLPLALLASKQSVVLTLRAQIVPAEREMLLRVEERELELQLDGRAEEQESALEALELPKSAVRQTKDCALYSAELLAKSGTNISALAFSIHPVDDQQFSLTTVGGSNAHSMQLLLRHNNSSQCSAPLPQPVVHLVLSMPDGFGAAKSRTWPLQLIDAAEAEHNASKVHFRERILRTEYSPTRRTFSPPVVALAHVEGPSDAIVQFGLATEEGGTAPPNLAVAIHNNHSGTIRPNNATDLHAALLRAPLRLQLVLIDGRGGNIADRAELHIELDAREKDANNQLEKRAKTGKGEEEQVMLRFEKPIYALAVDPYGMAMQLGAGIGVLETRPRVDERTGRGARFAVSEGGLGWFAFSNNGTAPNMLSYHGPIGQFPRDHTLKVLLEQHGHVQTAIVHVLIAGTGSAPPKFDAHFQRVLVPNDNYSSSHPLFGLSARDSDQDSRLVYALTRAQCRDAMGALMPECERHFSMAKNGSEWAVWTASGQTVPAEAHLNISVRDDAHPLDASDNMILLLKFVANEAQESAARNQSKEASAPANNASALRDAIAVAQVPSLIQLSVGLPANAFVHAFALPLVRPPSLQYSLESSERTRILTVDKHTGILSTVRALRGVSGRHQFALEVRYGDQRERIPFAVHIGAAQSPNRTLFSAESFTFEPQLDALNELADGMELGRVELANSSSADIRLEVLWPVHANTFLDIRDNGSISLLPWEKIDASVDGPLRRAVEDRNRPLELLVRANTPSQSSIVSVRLRLPLLPPPPHNRSSVGAIALLAAESLQLPESVPAGTYVFSADLDPAEPMPPLSQFTLFASEAASNASLAPLFGLERRAHSLLVRTRGPLRGLATAEGPLEVGIRRTTDGEGEEAVPLARVQLRLLAAVPCQPHFQHGQGLRIRVQQDALEQLTPEQWLPVGESVAALETGSRDCDPLTFELVAPAEERLVRVDPHTGVVSASPRLLQLNEAPIPLTFGVRSGPLDARIGMQLLVVRPPPGAPGAPIFVAPNPLLLYAREGLTQGTLVGTVAAVGAPNGAEVRYQVEQQQRDLGPSLLLEVDAHNGELRLTRALDYEALRAAGEEMPLHFTVLVQQLGSEEQARMEVQLLVEDINDNAPVFTRPLMDFVLEKDAPVGTVLGQVEVRDADECSKAAPMVRLLSAAYHLERFSRPVVPPSLAFRLHSDSGGGSTAVVLAAPLDSSPGGGHFSLGMDALDDQGTRSQGNGTATVWVADPAEHIVSLFVDKGPAQLDARALDAYTGAISAATSLRALLHEVRYRPGGIDNAEVQRHSSALQLVLVNATTQRMLAYPEAERALRSANLGAGILGFEQNVFSPSAGGPSSTASSASSSAAAALGSLLSLALLFLLLLGAVLAVLGVLSCQHRRRFLAERRLAEAAAEIRKATTTTAAEKAPLPSFASPPPPPPYSFLHAQLAEMWSRPLPPPPPPMHALETFYAQPHALAPPRPVTPSDYYTVQEMKMNL